MHTPNVSLIIPTYNFANYLEGLIASFIEAKISTIACEIIFVNDGSTDNTFDLLVDNAKKFPELKIKVHNLNSNQGRFIARLSGAEIATGKLLFFIDSRILLPSNMGLTIQKLLTTSNCLMGDISINENASPYSLYWKRTHEFIFRKNFENKKTQHFITNENFNKNLTGTGALIAPRDIFLKYASTFDSKMVLSDDNALLEKIVTECPILFDPQFFVYWEPRQTYKSFVKRMFERGPSFVEFHVFKKQGLFFVIVLIGLSFVTYWLNLLFQNPILAFKTLIFSFIMLVFSTSLFSKSPKEFFIQVPIHTGTILYFGIGILWGLIINSFKFIKTKGSMGYK